MNRELIANLLTFAVAIAAVAGCERALWHHTAPNPPVTSPDQRAVQ